MSSNSADGSLLQAINILDAGSKKAQETLDSLVDDNVNVDVLDGCGRSKSYTHIKLTSVSVSFIVVHPAATELAVMTSV